MPVRFHAAPCGTCAPRERCLEASLAIRLGIDSPGESQLVPERYRTTYVGGGPRIDTLSLRAALGPIKPTACVPARATKSTPSPSLLRIKVQIGSLGPTVSAVVDAVRVPQRARGREALPCPCSQ